MRFRTITMFLVTAAALAACSDSATEPTQSVESELEEVIFDVSASEAAVATAQDRRDKRPLPPRDNLTEAQKQCIKDAVQAFREANKGSLEQLHAIHKKAREAKAAGASREEVRAILAEAKPLLEQLREAHKGLHEKIRACLA